MSDGISIQQVPSLWPATITMISFLGVSWLTVSLRILTRGILIHSFGADDVAMLVALVSFGTSSQFIELIKYPKKVFYSVYCGAAVTCSLIVSGHSSLTIDELTASVQV
jgi:hypothetical protein